MPFGLKDPRPQLECSRCGHKERISPTHAAAAATNKGHVLCKECGGMMWMPGFGPAATTSTTGVISGGATVAPVEEAPLETVYVRRGDAGFGIVLDDGGIVVGGAGHTCETIPLGATVVSVNGVEVSCKADIVACIKDVAVSGQAEFTFRPVAPVPAPVPALEPKPGLAASVEPSDEDEVAVETAAKLKSLEQEFETGALTEDQYVAAKLNLIEPPGAGAHPSPRVSPPAVTSADGDSQVTPSLEPVVPLAQPQTAGDAELTPRTEAEIVNKYLGVDHASEAAAVLSAAAESEPEPEPESEPEAGPTSTRASASGILSGLASIDLDPRPMLVCSNPTCGNKERAKVADGVGAVGAFLSSSNHHVKCSECGSLLWMPGATKPGHSQVSTAAIETWTREFEACVPEGWEDAMQKADKHSRSTLIRLRNRARTALVLGPAESVVADSGIWFIEPPAAIQSGEEVVFGVGSRGLLRESGIGAAEGKFSYVLEPKNPGSHAPARDRVEFAIRVTNPVMSVPNVNERRCVAATTPPEGGCGTIHVGAVPDDHNNVVCVTVAEPELVKPPDLYEGIRAEQRATTAPPETDAQDLTDAAAVAVADALTGLSLVELSERAGLDAELLDGMLDAMDGDESAVEVMLREQIAANPELCSAPVPAPAPSKHELTEDELADRYLMGGAGPTHRRPRDAGADSDELSDERAATHVDAEEEKKELLAEAAEAQAAREAARAEFEAEMIGAASTVKKRQQDEAAAMSAAAQVKEAQEVLRDNAQKLGEMSDTTDEMQQNAQDFAAGIAALNQKKKGGFLGGLLS